MHANPSGKSGPEGPVSPCTGMEPFEIPCHGHRSPLSAHMLHPSQKKLPEAQGALAIPAYGLFHIDLLVCPGGIK